MDITQITEHLYVASRIRGSDLEAILQLDPGLIISMIVQRRPPKALLAEGLEVLWLRTFDFPLIPIPPKTLNPVRRFFSCAPMLGSTPNESN